MILMTSFRIIARAFQQWSANQDSRLDAATAYYPLFSITPLLILAITVAGWFFDEQQARENVYAQLRKTIDPDMAEAIKTLIEHSVTPQDSWGPIIGLAL